MNQNFVDIKGRMEDIKARKQGNKNDPPNMSMKGEEDMQVDYATLD